MWLTWAPSRVPLDWNDTSTFGPPASPGSTRIPVIWPASSPLCSPSISRTSLLRSLLVNFDRNSPGAGRDLPADGICAGSEAHDNPPLGRNGAMTLTDSDFGLGST